MIKQKPIACTPSRMKVLSISAQLQCSILPSYLCAVLRRCGPLEAAAAVLPGQGAHQLRLLRHGGLRAVELCVLGRGGEEGDVGDSRILF